MSLQKTEAIVLKTQRLGETSKILTLFSQKSGKIKVVAKGARGLKSRFYGTLEPLNHISLVYYYKETRELQLLSQADIIHPFVKIRGDLKKYSFGTFFCELIDRTQLEQPNKYLFQILTEVLQEMEKSKQNIKNFFFWFLLKFLHNNGFKPHFDFCQKCRANNFEDNVKFSILDGSFTCNNCNTAGKMPISIPADSIKCLHRLQVTSIKNVDSIDCISSGSCETLLLTFLQYHIEEARYLKSLKFLKNIQNSLPDEKL